MPSSSLRLWVDKGQGLRSGILLIFETHFTIVRSTRETGDIYNMGLNI